MQDAGVNFDAHLKPAFKCVGGALSKMAFNTSWEEEEEKKTVLIRPTWRQT